MGIFDFFTSSAAKELSNNRELAYRRAAKDAREKEYLRQRKISEMTGKHCPINGRTCSQSCVHFDDGRVFTSNVIRLASDEYLNMDPIGRLPGCKLWSNF